MLNSRKLAAPAIVLMLLAGTAGTVERAFAASPTTASQTQQTQAGQTQNGQQSSDQDLYKISDEAYAAIREAGLARYAIFNGDTQAAQKLVADAKSKIDDAAQSAVKLDRAPTGHPTKDGMGAGPSSQRSSAQHSTTDEKGVQTTTSGGQMAGGTGQAAGGNGQKMAQGSSSGDVYIPVDADLILSEAFTVTKENAPQIAKANAHMKAGDKQAARDALKLANIDVAMVFALVPAQETRSAIGKADELIGQQKYYEANLALKSVAENVVFDALDVNGQPVTPEQAAQMQKMQGSQSASQQQNQQQSMGTQQPQQGQTSTANN